MAKYKTKRFSDGTTVSVEILTGTIYYGIGLTWFPTPDTGVQTVTLLTSIQTLFTSLLAPQSYDLLEENTVGFKSTPIGKKALSLQFYGSGGTFDGIAVEDGKVINIKSLGLLNTSVQYLVPTSVSAIDGTQRVTLLIQE